MKRVEVPKELIEDFEAGVSMTQLSKKYGISRPTVRLRLLELGYETSDKHTEEEIALYHQMNQEGFTWEEIARIPNKKNPKGLSLSVTGINNIKMVYEKLYNDTSKTFAMERKLDKFEYIISYSRP